MTSVLFLNAVQNDDVAGVRDLAPSVGQEELNYALMRAAIIGHEEIVGIALAEGADINIQDEDGRSVLFLALRHRYRRMAEMYIERGIDINLCKNNCTTALHYAIKENEMGISRQIIATGRANLNKQNWGGNTPLIIACRYDRREIAFSLIDNGARIDICNRLGHYPIHYAAHNDDDMLAMTLVQKRQDPQSKTLLGVTPLMLACEKFSFRCLRYLAPLCNVNLHENLYGGTVLHWAIYHGAKDMTNTLLQHGASVLETDFSGRNCLMQIIQSKHLDILGNRETVLLILKQLKNKNSDTVTSHLKFLIHYACYLGKLKTVKALVETWQLEKYVLKKDWFGDNALVIALRMGYLDIAEYIMKRLKLRFVPDLPVGDPDILIPDATLQTDSEDSAASAMTYHQYNEGTSDGQTFQEDESQDIEGELVVSSRSIMQQLELDQVEESGSGSSGTQVEQTGSSNIPPPVLTDVSAVDQGDRLPSIQDYRDPGVYCDTSGSSGSSGTSGHTINDGGTCSGGSRDSSSGSSRRSSTQHGNYQPTSAKCLHAASDSSSPQGQAPNFHTSAHEIRTGNAASANSDYHETQAGCLLSPCSDNNTPRHPQNPKIDIRHYLIHRIYSLQNDERTQLMKKYKIFKTYSPIKMSLIEHLKSSEETKMMVPLRFHFSDWLDDGPEAFHLRVTNVALADWLEYQKKNALSLREACRKFLRRYLAYRASEKVLELPIPEVLKHYLNMKELDDLQLHDMHLSRRMPQLYDEEAD